MDEFLIPCNITVHSTSEFGITAIYNPWSVVKYLANNCKARTYWVSTGKNDVFNEIISKANETEILDLERLSKSEIVYSKLSDEISYKDLINSNGSLLNCLFLTGYLTTTGVEEDLV